MSRKLLDEFFKLSLKFIPKDVANRLKEELNNKLYKDIESSYENMLISFKDDLKIFSFSEINDSILMWSHYADYHKGFCIEYRVNNISYTDPLTRYLYPVIYRDSMFDATKYFTKYNKYSNELYLTKSTLVKYTDWSYEKEWRLVFPKSIVDKEQVYTIVKPIKIYLGSKFMIIVVKRI